MAYPRGYSKKELEQEIDKYGSEDPDSHLGASYYARASLGLTELERRNSAYMGWAALVISILALLFSIFALRYTAEQTRLTEIGSRAERIKQAQAIDRAITLCKENPSLTESGLFELETGKQVPCDLVLKTYHVEVPSQ